MPPIVLEVGANFVGIVHNDGGRGGLVVLTRLPKRGALAKPRVREALEKKATIEGLVTGAIKGGVEVDIDGLRAFAPASTMDVRPGADMKPFVGLRLDFHVTSYGKRGRDIVLSRKDLVEAEYKKLRAERLSTLVVGETVKGRVRTVVSFGAFIDLGGVEGLVPLQELSHNRSDGPSDVFSVGEEVEVKLIRVDDKGKIWLSRRALLEDPWSSVAAKYALGTRHAGKVVRIQPFGAFVELEPGIDGLIHAADLSFERFDDIHKIVKVGQTLDVVVSSLEMGQRRIALCPYNPDAEGEEPQKVVVHKSVKVKVVAHEPAGLVVRIMGVMGRGARAFITGAGTGTARGTDLKKEFPTGTVLEAKVLEIDPRRGEAKLSAKALRDDAERSAYNQYRKEVTKSSKFTLGDLLAKRGS
jgi:small subunit ribosomal protein S1